LKNSVILEVQRISRSDVAALAKKLYIPEPEYLLCFVRAAMLSIVGSGQRVAQLLDRIMLAQVI
jgi:hypothetical protein